MWKPASERAMPAAISLEALLESAQCFITHWLLYLSSSAAAVASRPTSRRDLSRQAGHPQQQGCEMWEACGRCEDGSQKGLRSRVWQRRACQLLCRLLARGRGRGHQHTPGSERRHSEEERRCGLAAVSALDYSRLQTSATSTLNQIATALPARQLQLGPQLADDLHATDNRAFKLRLYKDPCFPLDPFARPWLVIPPPPSRCGYGTPSWRLS